LAVLAIIFTRSPIHHFFWFIGPVLIIGLPIFDSMLAVIRRLARGASPLLGDRSHFYDWLHQKGFGIRQTVLLCCGIQVIIVAVGVIVYNL